MKLARWAAVGWIAGGIAWVATGLLGLGAADGTAAFYTAETAWLVVHLLILAGLVGLARSGAVGDLAWGTTGLRVAIVGRVTFLVAELASLAVGHDDVFLLPVAAVLTGAGMTGAGLAVVRAGRWTGPLRYAPLAMGVYPFVAMFPVLAVTGERPDTILSCWGLLMLAVGLAMTRATATDRARSATGALSAPGPLPAPSGR